MEHACKSYKVKFVEKGDTLCLYEGDEAFFKLYNKSPDDIGMCVEELFYSKLCKATNRICEKVKQCGRPLYYINEFAKLLWNLIIIYEKPYFLFHATAIGDYSALSEYSLVNTCGKSYKEFSILCAETDDDIIIESLEKGCGLPYMEGDSLLLIIENMQRIRSLSTLKSMIDSGKAMKIFDIYSDDVKEVFLMITIMPISHEKRRVVFRVEFLTEDEFYKNHQLGSGGLLRFTDQNSYAFAIVSNELSRDNIIYHNKKFKDIFESKSRNNFEILKHSSVASESYYNKCSAIGYVQLDDGFEYFVCITSSMIFHERFIFVPTKKNVAAAFENDQKLTMREQQMMQLIVEGYSNKKIAETLHIAEGTVKKMVYNTYRKLGVNSRVEMIRRVMFN